MIHVYKSSFTHCETTKTIYLIIQGKFKWIYFSYHSNIGDICLLERRQKAPICVSTHFYRFNVYFPITCTQIIFLDFCDLYQKGVKEYCFTVQSVQLVITVTTARMFVLLHTMAISVATNANAYPAIISTVVFQLPLYMWQVRVNMNECFPPKTQKQQLRNTSMVRLKPNL